MKLSNTTPTHVCCCRIEDVTVWRRLLCASSLKDCVSVCVVVVVFWVYQFLVVVRLLFNNISRVCSPFFRSFCILLRYTVLICSTRTLIFLPSHYSYTLTNDWMKPFHIFLFIFVWQLSHIILLLFIYSTFSVWNNLAFCLIQMEITHSPKIMKSIKVEYSRIKGQ